MSVARKDDAITTARVEKRRRSSPVYLQQSPIRNRSHARRLREPLLQLTADIPLQVLVRYTFTASHDRDGGQGLAGWRV